MRRIAWALLLLAVSTEARAQAPVRPIVRASLDPARSVTVGEPVSLVVEILVPTFFMDAPSLPALSLKNAAATLDDASIHTNETIGGAEWPGIRRTYRVVAQAPGTIQVPPVDVVVRYAIDGKLSDPFTVPTPALSFTAVLPPGAEDLDYFFAAGDLRVSERFDRKPETLKVGDAFVRTVTITADGVAAIELPPLTLAAPDGLKLVSNPPALSPAGSSAAGKSASREQTFTYTAMRPGHYTLPPIDVRYWNLPSKAIRDAQLPAETFDVDAGPAFGEEIALPPDPDARTASPGAQPTWRDTVRRWWKLVAAVLIAVAAVAWCVRRYGSQAIGDWRVRRARQAESESHYFARVSEAARGGDLRALHGAVLAWLARLPGGGPAPSLAYIVEAYGDTALARDVTQMTRTLYLPETGVVNDSRFARRLASGLSRARERLLAHPGHRRHAGARPLSPLNPMS